MCRIRNALSLGQLYDFYPFIMFRLNEWQKWKLSYSADCIIWALVFVPIIFKVFFTTVILNITLIFWICVLLIVFLTTFWDCVCIVIIHVCVWFSLFLDRERLFDLPFFKFACLHFPSTFWVDFFFFFFYYWSFYNQQNVCFLYICVILLLLLSLVW